MFLLTLINVVLDSYFPLNHFQNIRVFVSFNGNHFAVFWFDFFLKYQKTKKTMQTIRIMEMEIDKEMTRALLVTSKLLDSFSSLY